jgi:HAD superfamily hydrolase (TIGR01549 family)
MLTCQVLSLSVAKIYVLGEATCRRHPEQANQVMEHVKAICLDLDGTLWDVGPVIARAELRVYTWLETHYPRVTEKFSTVDLTMLRQRVVEDHPDKAHDLSHLRRMTFVHLMENAGYPAEMADQAFDVFQAARNEVTLFDDVMPALMRMSEIHPLYALTNGNADLKKIGLSGFFSGIFLAGELGVAKPDPRIFDIVCRRTGISPEKMLHVGDDPGNDIESAATLGMTTVWVNRTQSDWPDNMHKPDHEISDLHGLLALLDSETSPDPEMS